MKFLVSLYSWENPRLYESELDISLGDRVVVKGEFGNELGIVTAENIESNDKPIGQILRKATSRDIEAQENNDKKKREIFEIIRSEIKKTGLDIKLVDVLASLDAGSIIIIFSAEERIDFRELVKNLTKTLRRSVRMHQIGSRDEARKCGGAGICGRELCCAKFLKELPSISIETARIQQIAHRGSERISGQCGRLLCCLAYEVKNYQESMKDMPEIGKFVKTKEGRGHVIEINALTQKVKIKLEDGKIVSVHKKDL